ncbi:MULTISPECIES: 3-keto-5-aminohexanoate cleavage protein [unclassified Mesorhizobium]|uniref:3-keto-5-aminohexanoate cleavage protein n=1 Tax=unclassified Mesorhizobium TaxID=325217 RepID=UPI000467C276|nr:MULTISPECIES: 3-keto-5-aminohexanoate cleavage protein [unclassified Mesorhizobium]
MKPNSINWERVNKLVDREGAITYWKPYGFPEVMSAGKSAISGAEQMPRWKAPPKAAISVAINGAFYTKAENPNQPQTAAEIIASAQECIAAGAQIIHVHVRDERGYNALDAGLFAEVLGELRSNNAGVALDCCLVAVNDLEANEMAQVLERRLVSAVPVNTTALILGDNLFVKPPHTIIEKTRQVLAAGMTPQLAVYTDGDIDNARRLLIDSGVVRGPLTWLLLAGLPGCSPMYTPESMIHGLVRQVDLIRQVDPEAHIIVCAGGRASLHLATLGLLMGLHIRVGMEDTVWKWPHSDEKIERNVDVFKLARTIAESLGRELMSSTEFIEMCSRSGLGKAATAGS